MFVELLVYAPVTAVTLYVLYKWITLNDDYFVKRNLPHLKPKFLIGNMFGFFTNRYNPMEFLISVYTEFPGAK